MTATVAVSNVSAQNKVCRALVMSGGANRGAYEAGVIHGLSNLLNGSDANYDVVTGVSAGSLNTAAMSMWAPNQAKAMSDWLINFWRSVTGDMVFQEWPGGLQEGFYNRSGVFDTTPLVNTLIETMAQLGGQVKRRIAVSAVDVQTGEYVTYTEKNSKTEDLPQRFVASSSVPFVFPNQHIEGRVLMDGGTVWNTNLESAVERCREIVDRDEDIIMDVIICSDGKLDTLNLTGNTIDNYLRSWSLSLYHKSVGDVREQRRSNPKVQYRYFFMASKPLDSSLELLTFTPEVIEPMIQTGMGDAHTIVTTTKPGESFDNLDDWVDGVDGIREKYPHLGDYIYNAKGKVETF